MMSVFLILLHRLKKQTETYSSTAPKYNWMQDFFSKNYTKGGGLTE